MIYDFYHSRLGAVDTAKYSICITDDHTVAAGMPFNMQS